MKNGHVQALNYSAHAIEDIRETESKIRNVAPKSARALRSIISMLQNSVKFILPNCSDIFDPEDVKQAHLDLVRLPYPCVAFEAPWEKEDDVDQLGEFKQTPATKRIALCWETDPNFEALPGLNSILREFPEGGIFVVPIYWGPEFKSWTVPAGGAFHPHENVCEGRKIQDSLPASRIANQALIDAGISSEKGMHIRSEPFCLLPEYFDKIVNEYGMDNAIANVMMDFRDEVQMLIQACSVINCTNITTADLEAPTALNKKRSANGKQPFFSYKVLQLTSDKKQASSCGNFGGQHASPRMHLRRGHLRRLEGKVVWVRPAMVKADSMRGVVVKDYEVE